MNNICQSNFLRRIKMNTMLNSNNGSNGFYPVGKMIVAADETANAIANLRQTLESENQTYVNSDGTVYNPGDQETMKDSLSGGGFKPVDKAVVAAETAEAIANLRRTLESDNDTYVNSDGTVYNPGDQETTKDSLSGGGFKPVGKTVVSAETAEAIANLRRTLESENQTYVNSDGTVYNPGDQETMKNSLSGGGFKPVDKAVVAAQWYRQNPALQRAEIQAMMDIKPDAKYGFLPNGKMYWSIRLRPVIGGKRKDWTILMVYDDDHPQIRYGGSLKAYPVRPNIDEMHALVNRSSVTPKTIPHLLMDNEQQLYMCTQHTDNIHAGRNRGEKVTTAAACLRYAMRWINVFELGLVDPITWSKFQAHGEI
jgi:hypothetical protein